METIRSQNITSSRVVWALKHRLVLIPFVICRRNVYYEGKIILSVYKLFSPVMLAGWTAEVLKENYSLKNFLRTHRMQFWQHQIFQRRKIHKSFSKKVKYKNNLTIDFLAFVISFFEFFSSVFFAMLVPQEQRTTE